MEGYWLLRREARLDDAVHTVGARVDAAYGAWDFEGEIARQTGRYGGLPHRAALVHVGGSFTVELPGRPRLGAAFNSGAATTIRPTASTGRSTSSTRWAMPTTATWTCSRSRTSATRR